jgi:hypothetical protein
VDTFSYGRMRGCEGRKISIPFACKAVEDATHSAYVP